MDTFRTFEAGDQLLLTDTPQLGTPSSKPMTAEGAAALEALLQDGGSGTVDNAAVNAAIAESPLDSQRSMGLSAYNATAQPTKRIWRGLTQISKDAETIVGTRTRNITSIAVGDSVTCNIHDFLANEFGYGGVGQLPEVMTKESAAVQAITLQWDRSVQSTIIRIDESVSGGTYVETQFGPYLCHQIAVHYSAKAGRGKFQVQYQVNGAGAWTAITSASCAVTANGGSVSAGIVNSDNGLATDVYSKATFPLPFEDFYKIRVVALPDTTAGTGLPVDLCHVFYNNGLLIDARAASGKWRSAGGSFTWNAAGKDVSQFATWDQDMLNAAFADINPSFVIYKSANGYLLANYEANWPTVAAKLRIAAPDALLVVCGSHTRGSAPSNLDASDIAVDDYLRDWCANTEGAIFVDCRQNFPEHNRQVVLAGATGDNAADINGLIVSDDLWTNGRQSYSKESGGNTVTVQWNGANWIVALNGQTRFTSTALDTSNAYPIAFSASNGSTGTLDFGGYGTTAGLAEDLWSDGIHIYGRGEQWVRTLVWDAIQPAIRSIKLAQSSTFNVPAHAAIDEIRMHNKSGATANKFKFTTAPRVESRVVLSPPRSQFNAGTGEFTYESGFGMTSSDDAVTPHALTLYMTSQPVVQFGGTTTGNAVYGALFGGTTKQTARAGAGWRFLAPNQAGSGRPCLVAEGSTSMTAVQTIFQIARSADDSTAGAPVWSWINGGSVPSYLVNGAKVIGDNVITIDTGIYVIPVGARITFGAASDVYTVTVGRTGAGNITIHPALVADIADNAAVNITVLPSLVHNGLVNDANITTITYDEPAAAVQIHTAIGGVAGTGARPRYNFDAPGYADAAGAAADGSLPSGALYFDESTKVGRIKP